ncbi:galactoside 2-alpha-L-fucosyltransferase 1-like [Mizuhopecten yessoensis]|uniref:galactoside 2-alpha-L-fucosyltransferase 1-like n=1 Tax=Mizuhopecten yessoensis TaxID=6573 RepID=UPI000B45F634|nr:galactoside 2-alpha-L-fucosyltransferase 1-like [Mizuhopecten yessoensis]
MFIMKVTHVQQWCLRLRNRAKLFLITCIMLAVVVNFILVSAMYSEDWGHISFFKDAKRQAFQSQKYFYHVSMKNDVSFEEHHAGIYDCRIHNLTQSKNITLNGYFQSWKYFHHIRQEVRKLFQFTDDIIRRATKALNKFHPGNRTLIGVHVRRGDMNTPRELQRGYKVADLKYFRKVFEYFRYEIENALFIVVSDSVSWVKANLAADDVVISETGIAYLDMAILAQCKHSIITSGTFGWWGAYLAGGKTVYYKDYPKPKSWLSEQYNKMDYYPPNWIPM